MGYEAKLVLYRKVRIKILTNDNKFMKEMKKAFTYKVKGYFWSPKYRSGMWNGESSLITDTGTFPYGLLPDVLREAKKHDIKLIIDDEVKALFKGDDLNINLDLTLFPYPYQKESVEYCLKFTKGIIRSATACHAKGDKIILSTGEIKNIENIKIGDYVIGKDGNPKKVLNIFNGIDDLYKINPKNKRTPITVTKNHLLHLSFTNRGGKYDNKKGTFENISVEDYLNKTKWYKHISKLSYSNKNIHFYYKEINCKLSPYFIGLYLGDGHSQSCAITNPDKECVDVLYDEANKLGMKVNYYSYKKYSYFICGSENKRNKIFKEFDKIGLKFGNIKNRIRCEEKHIPKIIFNQNIEYRKEVMAGLIDSDGSLSQNRTYYEFTSKSKKLVDDTELLSISLGLVCSKVEKIVNNEIYYRLNIMGNIEKIPVRIKRKKNIKKSNTNAYRSAFKVDYIGREEFYGIQVEDSLYLTNNGMITHNSGKSLIISYIIKALLDNRDITKVRRALVIVPSKQLVEQFFGDMQEYGLKEKYIGRIYDKIKKKPIEWSKTVVITTWQSLKNNMDRINDYDVIIGDEAHQVKAHELKKIFSKSHARYRFGFTGTMPTDTLEMLNTKAFIGPILREYSSGLLGEQGYISKCNVNVFNIEYPFGLEAQYYDDMKKETFEHKFRMELIKDIVNYVDDNILLLVGYIREGKQLLNYLGNYTKRDVVFLKGKDDVDYREEWRQKMINEKNIALIATYGIFQQGINIPNLKYLVLAAPFKSKIRVLQSIGRTLRKHEDKEKGAFVFDIIDNVKYLRKHGSKRIVFYESEGFDVKEFTFTDRESYDLHQILPLD